MAYLYALQRKLEEDKNKLLPIWNKPALPPKELRGRGRIRLVKGSPEAKAFMARLRAMRGKNKAGKKTQGKGVPLGMIGKLFKKQWIDWGKDWKEEKQRQQRQIDELDREIMNAQAALTAKRKKKGGSQNFNDFTHGLPGWIRWGERDARNRKIEQKKKQLEDLKRQLQAAL